MKIFLLSFFIYTIVLSSVAEPLYNDVQQKSSHNSYTRDEGILDQLIYHRVRSVELDIFRSGPTNKDWRVMHIPFLDEGSNCYSLKDCLSLLSVFDEQYPQHEVVTVWVDMKNGFSGSHTPRELERLITQHIKRSDILKPSDLLSACPSATHLKDSVRNGCHWPSLAALKGKWIFVNTSGEYHNSSDRLMFKSDGVNSIADVDRSSRVFLNTDSQDNNLSQHIYNQGLVGRRYVVNSQGAFNSAIAGKVHHIATDKVNFLKDTWSKTHDANNPLAWPFRCITHCGNRQEKADAIALKVNSEDINGSRDHFAFAYQALGARKVDWTTSVNIASSHVDRWAKGCLMARASLSDSSPYFAVCRPSDNSKLVVQWRNSYGNNTDRNNGVNFSTPGNIEQSDFTYMRMSVNNEGKCISGFGSLDGKRWQKIGDQVCFSEALKYQGIAGSSHGNSEVRHIFSNLRRWNGPVRLNDLQQKNIGTVRSSRFYETQNLSAQWLYDLGSESSVLFPGYSRLSASTKTSTYGWVGDTHANISERDRGSSGGRNDINRDLLFNDKAQTFEQKVDHGNWYALITFGDIYLHDEQAVNVEGIRRVSNITTQPNQYKNILVAGKVTDGAFSLTFSDQGGQDVNWAATRILIQNKPFSGQAAIN